MLCHLWLNRLSYCLSFYLSQPKSIPQTISSSNFSHIGAGDLQDLVGVQLELLFGNNLQSCIDKNWSVRTAYFFGPQKTLLSHSMEIIVHMRAKNNFPHYIIPYILTLYAETIYQQKHSPLSLPEVANTLQWLNF